MRIKRGIILAAGMGRRLGALTKERPKALLQLNGEPLLGRFARQLAEAGLEELTVVVGYRAEQIRTNLGPSIRNMPITYRQAPDFQSTNNVASIAACGNLDQPVLIADCDVLLSHFPPDWLSPPEAGVDLSIPVRPAITGEAGTCVVNGDTAAPAMVMGPVDDMTGENCWKSLSIYMLHTTKLVARFSCELRRTLRSGHTHQFYEQVLQRASCGCTLEILNAPGSGVISHEIDTIEDLTRARAAFIQRHVTTNGKRSFAP